MKRSPQICALVLLLIVLLIIGAACNRKSKADQLAALERAKQSGVLTEDEYEAKRAAIAGPAPAPVAEPSAAAPLTPAIPPRDEPIAAASAPIPPQEHRIAAAEPVPQLAPAPPPPPQPAHIAKAPPPPKQEVEEAEPTPSQGCEDAEYKSKKKGPQARFFPKPEAQVKKAALAALATLDFTVHNDSGNDIEASKKRNASVIIGAGGERELLHFEPAQEGGKRGTRVTGETKKGVGRIAQKSWTAAVLAQIACNLK